jgi:hypothetical protein
MSYLPTLALYQNKTKGFQLHEESVDLNIRTEKSDKKFDEEKKLRDITYKMRIVKVDVGESGANS